MEGELNMSLLHCGLTRYATGSPFHAGDVIPGFKVLRDCSTLAQILRKPKNIQKFIVGLAVTKKKKL